MITTKWIQQISWRCASMLGNLKLSILLLLLIAISISLGTVIEQEKSITFYELNYSKNNPVLGILSSNLILSLGLDHVYSTTWFFFALGLFSLTLICCTITRQIPSLKLAKLWQFLRKSNSARAKSFTIIIENTNLQRCSYILRKNNYNVIQQGCYFYAYKGLLGKISPIFVHISMLVVLLGSVGSVLTNCIIQEIIPKGYYFHPQNAINSSPFSHIPQNFEGYVKDFQISYTDQGSIDQYYTDLNILDKNLETKKEKIIFVNEPLKYNEITFYQTDWGIDKLSLIEQKIEKEIDLQPITSANNSKFWAGSFASDKNLAVTIQDLTGNCLIYNKAGKLIGMKQIGSIVYLKGIKARFVRLLPSTGLQLKLDSGVPLIYLGFLILIPTIILSYTSYSQIWGIKKGRNLHVHAETNRALYSFERSVFELKSVLESNGTPLDLKHPKS